MKIQTATAGMVLTNGETYSKTVYLPDDAVNWAEIPESEMPIVEEEIEAINNQYVEPHQPTLEQRVADIEQVTFEVITALNEKGIVS